MTQRSVAVVILLSLFTCGIYPLYWIYTVSKELQLTSGRQTTASPTVLLILALFIPFVAWILFGMCADECINSIKASRGQKISDNKIVYILLAIFIPIVLIGLVQNEVNNI